MTKVATPPLLLVHGAWHGAWCWEQHFVAHFQNLGFEVYTVDLRQHGSKADNKPMRWNRISDYVDDVVAAVEAIGEPPIVIGHSMGGFVCQHLLERDVDLAGIGLLATVPSYGAWKATARVAVQHPAKFAKANLTWSLYPLVEDASHAGLLFLDADADEKTVAAFHARLIDESYLGFLDMVFMNLPKARKANIPMVIVGAEKDALFSPASQRWTADKYGCECHIIADAPHDLMLSKHWQKAADVFADWIMSASDNRS